MSAYVLPRGVAPWDGRDEGVGWGVALVRFALAVGALVALSAASAWSALRGVIRPRDGV